MKKPPSEIAWSVLVYSALAAARAKEAAEQWQQRREQKKIEDKLRRKIQSVWDALG